MKRVWRLTASSRPAVPAVLALSAFCLAAAGFLSGSPAVPFSRFFGSVHPVLATVMVVLLAIVAHILLRGLGGFAVIRPDGNRRGLLVALSLGPLFAIPTVLADVFLGFPEDINAPMPQALLFYPLMGYVAETAFHLLPLALLLIAARLFTKTPPIRALILAVALVEPMFQASDAFGVETASALDIFMIVHLTLFSIVLLQLYRRFDFITAFAFRLGYYLVWHILWGMARLTILF
jgi:hypothetical protein